MINNKSNTKIRIIATLVAIFMLISNFSLVLIGIRRSRDKILAYYNPVEISDGEFNSSIITEDTNLPMSPTNWSANSSNPSSVTAGIITIDREIATDDKITDELKLDKDNFVDSYPYMNDDQILMINAEDNLVNAGFSSSSIDMEKGGFYVVTFMAYTQIGSHASAKLVGYDELENSPINISTNGNWEEYKIYVANGNLSAISTNLELWLGGQSKSSGAVFFDRVKVAQYDNSSFMSQLNSETVNFVFVNLQDRYVVNFLNNADFEAPLDENNWKIISGSMSGENNTINGIVNVASFDKTATNISDNIQNTNISGNTSALLINNIKSGFVGYESATFEIEKNKIYKLSFLVKSNITSGSATVNLIENNPYTDITSPYYYAGSSYEAQTFTMSDVASSGTNDVTNGWEEKSFYIKGSPLINSKLNLEIMLGTSETGAKGYILFDNFTLETITSEEYTANSSDGTVADLNQFNKELTIKNGAFNLMTIETINQNYPYSPESWTLTTKNASNNILNGIVNTGVDGSVLSIPQVIYNANSNNNVLMIGNIGNNTQSYKSSSVSIEKDSFAKISVDVLTYNLNNAKAGITITDGNNILGQILNIETNNSWKTYDIVLKTGFESKTIYVELSLGENAEGTGYAFFDNVYYSSSLTEEAFDEDTTSKKIDLSKYDFSNISSKDSDVQGIFESYDFVGKNIDGESQVKAGVIDISKYGDTDNGYFETNYQSPSKPEGENNNILMIESDNDCYYVFTAKTATAIESDNYYKISVNVKTQGIAQTETNKQYKDSEQTVSYPYGASINIDGIDATFSGIDTNGEWKTYTFFVNCTNDSDIKLQLSLGSENALTSGAVYYSNAEISKIEEDEYIEGISVLENDSSIDNVIAIGDTDIENNDDEEEKSSNQINFDWLLVPSLIFGLAIIFAVVMVIIRNTKKKTHKRKVKAKNVYEINKTKNSTSDTTNKKKELVKKQNEIAKKLNEEKLKFDENSKSNIEKLQQEYDELAKQIAEIKKTKNTAKTKRTSKTTKKAE